MQHLVLASILLIVALLSVISIFRQIKFKNFFALTFSVLSAVTFGFFSIATIIDILKNSL
ncbi:MULTISPECIES: DUF2759 family protein [unclassified Virgibacillus]|uniref:DUF2759 family protein n=1 Tax=unclassified Virgibacillus TaxID=2620237 RepID=UPI0024DEC6D6|nr:DUF2759 family protein [Virgibacillus sp. LDC-1]